MLTRLIALVLLVAPGIIAQSWLNCFPTTPTCLMCKSPKVFSVCNQFCLANCPATQSRKSPELENALFNQPFNDGAKFPNELGLNQDWPLKNPKFAEGLPPVPTPLPTDQRVAAYLNELIQNEEVRQNPFPDRDYILQHAGQTIPGYEGVPDPTDATEEDCPNRSLKPCISKEEAEGRAKECCKKQGVPAACLKFCTLEVNLGSLIELSESTCDKQKLADSAKCFTDNKDVSDCCIKKGVPEYCVQYCNPAGNPPLPDASIANKCPPIVDTYKKINSCYHLGMNPKEE